MFESTYGQIAIVLLVIFALVIVKRSFALVRILIMLSVVGGIIYFASKFFSGGF
jgi:hypothetical protein